ncbi:MAG: aminotransferase class I/II-fold pyridoxal phosphate-dependent enzyme [Rhodospirillaceae bacterium]
MAFKVSQRGRVPPFLVMDVMKAASKQEAAGRDVIHLEVGQPETGLPKIAAGPVKSLIDQLSLGYTVASGILELRTCIVEHYRKTYGVVLSEDSVFVTTGSSAGFQLAFLAAFDPGDRVALASPGYPAYRHILTSLGLEPVLLDVGEGTRFQPSVDLIKELDRPIDGLIIASPSNPTGTIIPKSEFTELVEYCHREGIRLISDEIYHGISFDTETATAARPEGYEIVVNSFSKYFCMTGWRIGWIIVPPDLMRSVECLAQNHYISPPTISQWAAVHAFEGLEELEQNVARYRRNRDILIDQLRQSGLKKIAPSDGAFYLYLDISDSQIKSDVYCRKLLEDTGVAITPGYDFDPLNGDKNVRISFSVSTEKVIEAANRIKLWSRSLIY